MERFKKIFAASVIFVTVLSMSVVVVPNTNATASAGDLIKMAGLSSVYYLSADGKRYVFPSESTYFSWYSDFSGVVTVPQAELESYPLGKNVTMRPGTKLVKITTNPKVFAVTPGGSLVWVNSEATALALYGANWAKRVVDVSDAFWGNYTETTGTVSATAYPAGSLVKFGTSADVFYINADGTASKISTEAALAANRFKLADVITATIAKPTEGAQITGVVSTLTDTASGAGGSIGAGSGVTVALASDTPASATVITNVAATGNGQAAVAFTKVNFTAASDGDVKVTNLKFKRTGISADADIESLYLYEGNTRLTAEASVSSNIVTFNNAAGLFSVTKGTTKGITLKGDMLFSATSGKTIGFSLVAATDVTTNGAAVSGSFPMAGNLMSTANATDLGKLTLTYVAPAAPQTIDPNTLEAEVAKITFASSEQALSVEKVVLTEIGSVQTDDLANFKLLDPAGTVIGTVASMNSSYEVVFDLSATPYAIAKGVSKTLSLRADVVKGSTRTFYFSIQNKYDVLVKDTSYNVYVEPYAGGNWQAITIGAPVNIYTINPGTLSINRTTLSPSGDITKDGTSVVVGAWDLRAAGEDMKVKDLSVYALTAGTVKGGLDNVKIYVDGAQIGSTKDLTDTGVTAYDGTGDAVTGWGFGSSFIVKAGTTAKVTVLADIKTATSTSFTGNETVRVSIATGASDVQKMSSLGYQAAIVAPNWGTSAALNVIAAGVTVSKYSGYGNQTIVAGSNGVKLGSFVVTAGASEGINLSSITVALSTDEAATVTNMYLTDSANVVIGTAKNVPGTSNIYSLSPNIALAANASKQINLYGNVKSASNVGAWIANIDADGSGVVTGNAVSAAAQDIQTMTVAASGTLTVVNGSMPDAAVLLAGSTGNYVAEYQFSATNEGFTVDKLLLGVTNNFSTSTAAVTLAYTDKNGVAQTKDGMFLTGASNVALFTGLTMYVPANSDATLKVYLSLTSIASGAASGASSAITLDNAIFNATGDSGTPQTTFTADLDSNIFTVRKSKPTFAKLDAGTDPVGGALYKFSVVADNAGNIDIKQLSFTVATTLCNVNSLSLYDPNSSVTLTDDAVSPTTEGSSVKLLVGGVDNDVLTISNIAKTYELRGLVTGYSASGDSIVVRMTQDTFAGVVNASAATINAARNNTWSDRSGISGLHTTATTDWTSTYLLKDMSQTQSFNK
ncbi:MAG: hypothetical protein WCL13_01595 [bacterium]